MADWTVLTNEELEPGAPARSSQAISLRDNIIAQAEGATGAPKTQTAAIEDDAVTADKLSETTEERNWVNGRIATSSVGAVGTYAMLRRETGVVPGNTYSGGLTYSNGVAGQGGAAGGTWRAMGGTNAGTPESTLFLRVS